MPASPTGRVIEHLRRTVLLHDEAGLTDGQLLDCFVRQRDQVAFAALVRRHAPMVWGVCRRVLAGHHDAEDAFQATFLVLVRKAASVKPRELVGNWLYGVAHRIALSARTGLARRRSRERQVMAMPEPAHAEERLGRDLQSLLDLELSRLPQKYRVAIVLCDLGGRTRKDAAQHLGVPEGTLSGRLSRGRALLAKRLARHGLPITGAALAAGLAQPALAAPPAVVSAMIQATSLGATAEIPARVAALVEGVLKAMLMTKLKIATAVLLALTLLGAGVGIGGLGGPTLADDDNAGQAAQAPQAAQKPKGERLRPDAGSDFLIFRLKHVDAAKLAKTLVDLFADRDREALRIIADARTNSLLVRGQAEQIALVKAAIARLDEPDQDARDGGTAAPPAEKAKPVQPPKADNPAPKARAEVSLFTLKHAQAVDVAKTLQELLQDKETDGPRIAADPGSNSVVVRGRREQMEVVEALIVRLDEAAAERLIRQHEENERLGIKLALPTAKPAGTPTTVTARQGKRAMKFSAGLTTSLEGLALAVLGTCSVDGTATVEQWRDALKGDHLRIVFAEPRAIGVSPGKDDEVLAVSEIVLPLSAEKGPGRILVRSGDSYRGFAKYQMREVQLLRDRLRELHKEGGALDAP